MDALIVKLMCQHLCEKDLICFAMVNKTAYNYCKHTNILGKKFSGCHHCPHNYVPTLMEHARLEYAMGVLVVVKELTDNKVPMRHCSCVVTAHLPCGGITKIVLGRHIMINDVVYYYSKMDAICDVFCRPQKGFVGHTNSVLYICQKKNMERLRHRINSILTHRYDRVEMKMVLSPLRDIYHAFAEKLQTYVTTRWALNLR